MMHFAHLQFQLRLPSLPSLPLFASPSGKEGMNDSEEEGEKERWAEGVLAILESCMHFAKGPLMTERQTLIDDGSIGHGREAETVSVVHQLMAIFRAWAS